MIEAALRRYAQYGPNKLAEEEKISKIKILIHQFTNPLIYVPALQWVFRTEPLGITEWLRIGLVAVTVVIVVEIDKMIRRRSVKNEPHG